MVQTREEKLAQQKDWREKNREANLAKKKAYYEANKEEISAQKKAHYEKNRETILAKAKAYYETPEGKEKKKDHSQTPQRKKSSRISKWKQNGLICDDVDALYEKYLNTKNCEECDIELTVDRHPTKTRRVMDHCHVTGLFRNVLCNLCNVKRG